MISNSGPTKGNFEIFFLLFIFGWIIHLIGHFSEKKRHALTDSLWQVLIAPLFLISEAYFYFGMMHELYLEVHDIDHETIEKNNKIRYEQNHE